MRPLAAISGHLKRQLRERGWRQWRHSRLWTHPEHPYPMMRCLPPDRRTITEPCGCQLFIRRNGTVWLSQRCDRHAIEPLHVRTAEEGLVPLPHHQRGYFWYWFAAIVGLLTAALALGDDGEPTRDFADRNVSCLIHPQRPLELATSSLNALDYAPYIEIESPLYRAIYNRETRCCVWIHFRVRAEDVVADNHVDRGWWFPGELREYGMIGNAHYRDSGYDRGHLRSIAMSRGSEHWRDVNCLCVIIPEVPELNRGDIAQLESHVCDLATAHGWCDVTITLTGDAGDMPRAGSHQIPETIRYVVESPAGREEVEFENLKAEPTPARPRADD